MERSNSPLSSSSLIETMPKLVFKNIPNSSPSDFPLNIRTLFIRFGKDDGLDQEYEFNTSDREQRQEFLRQVGIFVNRLNSRQSRAKVWVALEQLSEYEDCAMSIAQLVPELAVSSGCTTPEGFLLLKQVLLLLACHLEAAVNVEVTESIRQLMYIVDEACVASSLRPFIEGLVELRWAAPRSVGAGLLVELAKSSSAYAEIEQLKKKFERCCQDESILVRRAACRSIFHWATFVESHTLAEFPLPLMHYFLTEEKHDTIQIELVNQVVVVGAQVGRVLSTRYLLQIMLSLCRHSSWRVRYVAATQMGSFCTFVTRAEEFVNDIIALAHDEEVEVAAAILRQIHIFAKSLPSSVLETYFVPEVDQWISSEHATIRSAIAISLHAVVLRCPHVAKGTLRKLLTLLDDSSDLVNTTAVGSLHYLLDHLQNDDDDLKTVVDAMTRLTTSKKWRLREGVVVQWRHFCGVVSPLHFAPLKEALQRLMLDPVAAVRAAVIGTLAVAGRQYGPQWSGEVWVSLLSNPLDKTTLQKSHIARMALASVMESLLPIANGMSAVSSARRLVEETASEIIESLAVDPVSNVRVALARAILVLMTCRCDIASVAQQKSHQKLLIDSSSEVQRAITTPQDEPF